jgi:hypothetical protein
VTVSVPLVPAAGLLVGQEARYPRRLSGWTKSVNVFSKSGAGIKFYPFPDKLRGRAHLRAHAYPKIPSNIQFFREFDRVG